MLSKSIVAVGVLLSIAAQAGSISTPYDLESTSVLPKNVKSPRYKSIFLKMEEKYNSLGNTEPIGSSLNANVAFQTLVDAQPTANDRALAEGSMTANGIPLSASAGRTTGQVNTAVNVIAPVFSYGITSTWTGAVVVPVYTIKISADTGFVASAQAQQWATSICNSNPEKCASIQKQLADPVNAKAEANGYHRVRSEQMTAVGDVKLISKHMVYKTQKNAVAVKGTLTLPTGTHPNADKLVDNNTGDGQTDLGARVIYDRELTGFLGANTYFGYTAQLPDQLERRIPRKQGDGISPDKERLRRDSGDIIDFGVGMTVDFLRGFAVGLGYSYQYMTEATFRGGSRYESERYDWLNELYPSQEMQALTASLSYSTVELYRAGAFKLPFTAGLTYGRPLVGRNVTASDVYSGELILFF